MFGKTTLVYELECFSDYSVEEKSAQISASDVLLSAKSDSSEIFIIPTKYKPSKCYLSDKVFYMDSIFQTNNRNICSSNSFAKNRKPKSLTNKKRSKYLNNATYSQKPLNISSSRDSSYLSNHWMTSMFQCPSYHSKMDCSSQFPISKISSAMSLSSNDNIKSNTNINYLDNIQPQYSSPVSISTNLKTCKVASCNICSNSPYKTISCKKNQTYIIPCKYKVSSIACVPSNKCKKKQKCTRTPECKQQCCRKNKSVACRTKSCSPVLGCTKYSTLCRPRNCNLPCCIFNNPIKCKSKGCGVISTCKGLSGKLCSNAVYCQTSIPVLCKVKVQCPSKSCVSTLTERPCSPNFNQCCSATSSFPCLPCVSKCTICSIPYCDDILSKKTTYYPCKSFVSTHCQTISCKIGNKKKDSVCDSIFLQTWCKNDDCRPMLCDVKSLDSIKVGCRNQSCCTNKCISSNKLKKYKSVVCSTSSQVLINCGTSTCNLNILPINQQTPCSCSFPLPLNSCYPFICKAHMDLSPCKSVSYMPSIRCEPSQPMCYHVPSWVSLPSCYVRPCKRKPTCQPPYLPPPCKRYQNISDCSHLKNTYLCASTCSKTVLKQSKSCCQDKCLSTTCIDNFYRSRACNTLPCSSKCFYYLSHCKEECKNCAFSPISCFDDSCKISICKDVVCPVYNKYLCKEQQTDLCSICKTSPYFCSRPCNFTFNQNAFDIRQPYRFGSSNKSNTKCKYSCKTVCNTEKKLNFCHKATSYTIISQKDQCICTNSLLKCSSNTRCPFHSDDSHSISVPSNVLEFLNLLKTLIKSEIASSKTFNCINLPHPCIEKKSSLCPKLCPTKQDVSITCTDFIEKICSAMNQSKEKGSLVKKDCCFKENSCILKPENLFSNAALDNIESCCKSFCKKTSPIFVQCPRKKTSIKTCSRSVETCELTNKTSRENLTDQKNFLLKCCCVDSKKVTQLFFNSTFHLKNPLKAQIKIFNRNKLPSYSIYQRKSRDVSNLVYLRREKNPLPKLARSSKINCVNETSKEPKISTYIERKITSTQTESPKSINQVINTNNQVKSPCHIQASNVPVYPQHQQINMCSEHCVGTAHSSQFCSPKHVTNTIQCKCHQTATHEERDCQCPPTKIFTGQATPKENSGTQYTNSFIPLKDSNRISPNEDDIFQPCCEPTDSCICCKKTFSSKIFKLIDNINGKLCDLCAKISSSNIYPDKYSCQNHQCICYSLVGNNTLDQLKCTLNDLKKINIQEQIYEMQNCNCCKTCGCKCKPPVEFKNGCAYFLKLEDTSLSSSCGSSIKEQRILPEVTVKVPVPRCRRKIKEKCYVQRKCACPINDPVTNTESAEDFYENGESCISLQEQLWKNYPQFINRAENRRRTLKQATSEREANAEKRKLQFLDLFNNKNIASEFENYNKEFLNILYMREILTKPTNQKPRLFSHDEMKRITKKKYKNLPEIQKQKDEFKKMQMKSANRMLANTFTKRLQKCTLRGTVDIPSDVKVVTY